MQDCKPLLQTALWGKGVFFSPAASGIYLGTWYPCVPVFLSHRLFLSFVGGEGSAETGQKETSTCDICQFGAECDVDAEDVW